MPVALTCGRHRCGVAVLESASPSGWLAELSDRLLDRMTSRCPAGLVLYGTEYGGWQAVESGIEPTDIVVSAGAGEDLSFDLALATRFGCTVHIFDPTPRAVAHFEQTRTLLELGAPAPVNNSSTEHYPPDAEVLKHLVFHPYGLWREKARLPFFAPASAEHVSHSICNLQGSASWFAADCLSISDVAERIGTTEIKLLKLDIEGAEYAVLRDLVRSSIRPGWLLVEFHPGRGRVQRALRLEVLRHVSLVRRAGYHLVARRGLDLVFMHTRTEVASSS